MITEYEVLPPMGIRIVNGTLMLNEAQAKRRAKQLKKVGDNLYEVIAPTMFKCGERIGWDGNPSKVLLQALNAVDDPAPGLDDEDQGVKLNDMKVDELKSLMDEQGIKYAKKDKKEALINKIVPHSEG